MSPLSIKRLQQLNAIAASAKHYYHPLSFLAKQSLWLTPTLGMLLALSPAQAQLNIRQQSNDRGDIRLIGNTLMTCGTPVSITPPPEPTPIGTCANAQSNNNRHNAQFNMQYVDVDSDPTTFNSSNATLNLPAGATVLWAGLYWHGRSNPANASSNQARFRTPLSGTYINVTANDFQTNGQYYQAFRNVTNDVQAAGNGVYWVANVQANQEPNFEAGWSLIVVYRDPTQPFRTLNVYDGLPVVFPPNDEVDITLTGFRTPASGPYTTRIGIVVYDGDAGIPGDTVSLNNTPLFGPRNPENDFWNSTITSFSDPRNPNFSNQLGLDIELLDDSTLDNSINLDEIIGSNATSATFTFTTNTTREGYFPGIFTLVIDSPLLEIQKTGPATVTAGNNLVYTITVTSRGAVNAEGVVTEDVIPPGLTFVSNSGACTTPFPCNLGSIPPGQSRTITTTLAVPANYNGANPITNNVTATSQNDPAVRTSTVSTTVVSNPPDLTITKTHTGNFTVGQQGTYTITVNNGANAGPTTGQITLTDTLPAGLTFVSASGTGWTCAANGQVVTCNNPGPINPGASSTLTLTVNATAAGSGDNQANVSTPGETNTGNNSATDPTTIVDGPANVPDLSITKTHTGNFTVGQQGTYTITVSNAANAGGTTQPITVTDTLPTGLSFVSASGSGWTCSANGQVVTCTNPGPINPGASSTLTLTVNATAAGNGNNQANVSTPGETNTGNNSATDPTTIVDGLANVPDLSITKTHTGNFTVGQQGTYTIAVSNAANASATTGTITVTDTLPAGLSFVSASGSGWTCSANGQVVTCTNPGPINPGASSTLTLTVNATAAGNGNNSANVSTPGETNTGNNNATDPTTIVSPANQPPVANDNSATTPPGTPVNIPILGNDSDPDNNLNPNSVTITDQPDNGTVTVNPDGTVTYTPNPGFSGTDTFNYQVCDTGNPPLCDTATVTVTVPTPVNRPPVPDNKTAPATPNTATAFVPTLTATDPDPGNTITSFTIVSPPDPSQGTLLLNGQPVQAGRVLTPLEASQLTFQPNPNFTGNATFTYNATDNLGATSTSPATVTLPITAPANRPPVANNDSATTNPGTPVNIPVLGNDNDPDNNLNPSSLTINNPPGNGTVTVNPDGTVTYTPNPGFTGTDTFTYQVCDTGNPPLCDTATVTVTVPQVMPSNQPPNSDDKATPPIPNTTPTQVPPLTGSDPDGTVVSFTITTLPDPSQGTLLLNGQPVPAGQVLTPEQASQLVFQPNPNFTGNATFNYTTTDNQGLVDASPATVTIPVIAPPNQPPVADDKTTPPTPNTTPIQLPPLTGSDPDGTIVSFTITRLPDPSQGTLFLNGQPVQPGQVLTPEQASQLVFQPNPNFTGNATFNYTTTDNQGLVDASPATVTIPVIANEPPVAEDKATPPTPNTTPTAIPPLSATDPDNDPIVSFTITTLPDPSQGTLLLNGQPVQAGQVLTPEQGSQLTFQPNPNFTGNATFTYTATDSRGAIDASPATVTIPVTPPNQPPVANNDNVGTNPGTPVTINVLVNDRDPDNNLNPGSISVVSNPASGTVTVNPDGTITYTPIPGFTNGTDSFVYQVCDTTGLCDTATVTVTVPTPVPLPPVANDDRVSTNPNTPVLINVLGNDTDPNNNLNPTSVTLVSNPANGTVSVNPITGQISYTPNPGFTSGTDTFVYQVCDTTGLCDTATVTVSVPVSGINPPIATNDSTSTNPNTPVLINVLANDSDPDGNLNPSSIRVISNPANGTVRLNPDGTITYTPNPGFTNGTDIFVYEVCDTTGLCDTATVTVTVPNVVPRPPVATDDNASTNPDTPVVINVTTNDRDPDGNLDPTTVQVIAQPTNGRVTVEPGTGQIIYTPNPGFTTGTDTFTYQVCDTSGLCDTATVTVRVPVTAANPPVANNDAIATDPNTPAIINVLANDTDPDGNLNPSSVRIVGNPANGTVTVNPTTGQITYTPNPGFTTGTDTFTYQVCDTSGLCSTATVTVSVPRPSGNQSDLQVIQTGPTNPVPVGSNIPFDVQVTNNGPGIATGVILTNPLPEGVTLVQATPSQGSCTLSGNTLTCDLGNLNPGQTVNIAIVVAPTQAGTLSNTVTATAANDATPNNNTVTSPAQILQGQPRLRLLKRITSIVRDGATTNFTNFVDDLTDENDNAPGWSQLQPVGVTQVTPSTPLRSGDIIEYTLYFLSDGNVPIGNANFCDAIPTGTTFIRDGFGAQTGVQLNRAGVNSLLTNGEDADAGRFFSSLAPLPPGNPCANQSNPNGSVIINLPEISNTSGSNFGFIRFRVGID